MADETTVSTLDAGPSESSPEPAATGGMPAESTPASETQAAEPQAQPQTEPPKVAETVAPSPRERLKELLKDPEMERAYQEHLNTQAQRLADKKLKRERLSRAQDDPVAALDYVQAEHEAMTAEETSANEQTARFTEAGKSLADLWKSPTWAEVYNELRATEGRKFHEEWSKDPVAFVDKLDDRITEILIDRKAAEKAKTMTEARVLEETNKRLANLPVPPTGSAGGGGVFTLAQIEAMDSATYKANEEAIDRQYGIRKR